MRLCGNISLKISKAVWQLFKSKSVYINTGDFKIHTKGKHKTNQANG